MIGRVDGRPSGLHGVAEERGYVARLLRVGWEASVTGKPSLVWWAGRSSSVGVTAIVREVLGAAWGTLMGGAGGTISVLGRGGRKGFVGGRRSGRGGCRNWSEGRRCIRSGSSNSGGGGGSGGRGGSGAGEAEAVRVAAVGFWRLACALRRATSSALMDAGACPNAAENDSRLDRGTLEEVRRLTTVRLSVARRRCTPAVAAGAMARAAGTNGSVETWRSGWMDRRCESTRLT